MIFISYRRDYGGTFALLLEGKLRQLGFSVFLDHKSMHAGRFDQEILDAIDSSTDVVILLSRDCFKRRKDPDYYFQEIEYSISNGKRIIPVLLEGFETNSDVPQEIADLLKYQSVEEQKPQNFDSVFIPDLISYLSDSDEKRRYNSKFVDRSIIASREVIEREPLSDRWKDAVEIDICSYFANMLINTEYISKALESGTNIKYLVVDPESDAADNSISFLFKKTKKSRFKQAYEAAEELLEDWSEENKLDESATLGTFELRKTELFLPNAIMIVKKKEKYKNTIKVDFYTFDTGDSERRSTLIKASDLDNYEFFEKQFDYIWNSEHTFVVKAER